MKKSAHSAAGRDQKGVISLPVIIGGIVVLVVIFLIATGSFKFSASVKPNNNQSYTQPASQPTSDPVSKPKTYQSEANGISLEYPASWSLKENPTSGYIAVFSSPKEGGNNDLGLKVVDISSKPTVTLQEIADLWENQTKAAEPSFAVTDRKTTSLAGEDAKEIVYNFKTNQVSGKGMTKITLKNKKAYIFQYNAGEKSYDKFLPDVEAILASVKF